MSDFWRSVTYKGFQGFIVAQQKVNHRLTGVLVAFTVPKDDKVELERFKKTMEIYNDNVGRVVNRIIPLDELDEKLS